jgi:hypothetical protein
MNPTENIFTPLEAKLSPHAKHALEAYVIGFWRGDQELTVRQLRDAIRSIYGAAVDRELEQHFGERRDAVLPDWMRRYGHPSEN